MGNLRKLVVILALLFSLACVADIGISSGKLRLSWDENGVGSIHLSGKKLPGALKLSVIDGKKGKPYALAFQGVRSQGGSAVVEYADAASGLKMTLNAKPEGELIRLDLLMRNETSEQMLVETWQYLPYPADSEIWYDGFEDRRISGVAMIRRETLHHTFPVMAVFSKNAGLAYGFDPEQMLGFFENRCEKGSFGQNVRVVVPAKGETTLRQVVYAFTPDYGTDSAVEHYFRCFPKMAKPVEGVDPRMFQGCEGGQENRPGKTDYTEYNRVGGASWIWDYAPFRATGDFAVHADVHERFPINDLAEKLYPGYFKCRDVKQFLTYQTAKYTGKYEKERLDFLAKRKQRISFQNRASNIASLFYIISMCDLRLAQDRYKDAMLVDPDTTCLYGPGWVHVMAFDHSMSLWNNQFEKDMKRDLKEVTQELEISGFSYDCISQFRKCRLPSIAGAPGLSWDETGIFLNQQIETSAMVDFLHSLRRGDLRMGVAGNGTGSFFLAFKSDLPIVEANPFKVCENFPTYVADRRLWGNRTGGSFYSIRMHDRFGQMIDYSAFSPEQLRAAYRSLLELSVLQCFNFGFYPNIDWIFGHEYPARYVHVIRDVLNLGPQIVPAVRCCQTHWIRRYGSGLNSYLFIGNSAPEPADFAAAVDNRSLGGKSGEAFLVTDYFGVKTANEVAGNATKVSRRLQPREPWLLKPVLKIAGAGSFTADVREERTFAASALYADINGISGKDVVAFARIAPEFEAVSLLINGKPARFSVSEGGIQFRLPAESRISLVLASRSKSVRRTPDELKTLGGATREVKVSLPGNADSDHYSDVRIRNFFRMYYDEKGTRNPPSFQLKEGKEEISLAEGTLCITAPTPERRYELVTKTLEILEPEYLHIGKIGVWPAGYPRCGETRKMREKAGMTPKTQLLWEDPGHFMNLNLKLRGNI